MNRTTQSSPAAQSKSLDLSFLPEVFAEALRCYLRISPEQRDRLEKALRYVKGDRVSYCNDGTDDVFVESETRISEMTRDPIVYRVGNARCECGDFVHNKTICCHRLARRIFWRWNEMQANEDKTSVCYVYSAEHYVASGSQLAGIEANYARIRQEPIVEATDEEFERKWQQWCRDIENL
jgi:hypothetical protein